MAKKYKNYIKPITIAYPLQDEIELLKCSKGKCTEEEEEIPPTPPSPTIPPKIGADDNSGITINDGSQIF